MYVQAAQGAPAKPRLFAGVAAALLDLAVGVTPQVAKPVPAGRDPFAHPDAFRRFRVMANVEELERALDYPWDKWAVFLHPAQRTLVERSYSGPARVAGSRKVGHSGGGPGAAVCHYNFCRVNGFLPRCWAIDVIQLLIINERAEA